jgi:hypothetical protein
MGGTSRRTEAWQELPFKRALNRIMQLVLGEKENQRRCPVVMLGSKSVYQKSRI